VRVFQSTYVGQHDFPKSLPDFLLQQWFTLNDRDRRAIRKAFRSRYWVGAALQLGFVAIDGMNVFDRASRPAGKGGSWQEMATLLRIRTVTSGLR